MNWLEQAKSIFSGGNTDSFEKFSKRYFNRTYLEQVYEAFKSTVDCNKTINQQMICNLIRAERLKITLHLMILLILVSLSGYTLYRLKYKTDIIQEEGTIYAISLHKKFRGRKVRDSKI